MGGYDLYGKYYPNSDDALNAEMSQCNEIDNRINEQRISGLQKQINYQMPNKDKFNEIWQYIKALKNRIELLENQFNK